MRDPIDVVIVHRGARALAEVLWAIGDALGHIERLVYTVSRKTNDAGHATLDAACSYSEERVA
jgi:hypothetical protein